MAAKGIEIRVGTVGTEQASSNIKKIEESIGIVIKSEKELAANRAQFLSAAEAEVAEVNRLTEASKRLNEYSGGKDRLKDIAQLREELGPVKKLSDTTNELAASKNKVTASSANMRFGLQNVGYQIQDFAVQTQMGTSAARAFGQQAPQLLSALGPWGVALGTVVALGAPLIPMLMGQSEAAGEAADAFDASAKKMADVIAKQESASWKEFVTQLDDETEAIKRNNEALARKKELTDAIEAANKKLDEARLKAVKDEIDADPTMSDADKIRAKGAVDDAQARKNAAAEIKKMEDAAKQAEADAAEKVKRAQEASEKTDAVRGEVESEASEIARLEKRKADVEKNRRTAEQQLPKAESDAKWLYAKKYLGTGLPGDAERSEKSQAADLRLANLKSMANDQMAPDEEARLGVLKKEQAKREAELKRREEAEKEAREAANKAGLDAENKRAILTETAPRIREAYEVESGSRRATTESRAADAERRAAQREQAKRDAEQRKADELAARRDRGVATADAEGSSIGMGAADAARGLGLPPAVARKFEELGAKISKKGDNGDAAMLNEILSLLGRSVEAAGKAGKDNTAAANKLRSLEQKVANLEGQLKTTKTGK